jgi:hypothetical protein
VCRGTDRYEVTEENVRMHIRKWKHCRKKHAREKVLGQITAVGTNVQREKENYEYQKKYFSVKNLSPDLKRYTDSNIFEMRIHI